MLVVLLAGFSIAVGTRKLDATEHQRGLMLAVAAEAAIKLVAFVVVGVFVTWGVFSGIGDLVSRAGASQAMAPVIARPANVPLWLAVTASSMAAMLIAPRQFQVSIVENRNPDDVRAAAWVVPLYLVVINLFIVAITMAGLATFPPGLIDREFTVLALPIHAGSSLVTLVALIGGFAAATSMIFVATIVLAVMVSNDLVIPVVLRVQAKRHPGTRQARRDAAVLPILHIRRVAIVVVMALSGACAHFARGVSLSSIGFLSLLCLLQIAPAAIGGLFWERGTARGAIGGSIAGILVAICALAGSAMPGTMAAPIDAAFDLAPFQTGLVWSLGINALFYVALSLSRQPTANERSQAHIFVKAKTMTLATSFRLRQSSVTIGDLATAVSRFMGRHGAERAFADYHVTRGLEGGHERPADVALLQHAELLIASVAGAASSRTVMSLLLETREFDQSAARRIMDDVTFEIQSSRGLLQHAIDEAREGMAIFDAEDRLVAWNRAYCDLFQFPPDLTRVGVTLTALIRSNVERGVYADLSAIPAPEDFIASRFDILSRPTEHLRMHVAPGRRVLDMRSVRLNNGGLFFTYTDATAQAKSAEDLEAENETLEQRVRERTEELQSLNYDFARATAEAEDANISKTRFLAAASHDLLQPLSAARLYTTSLRERMPAQCVDEEMMRLAGNIDASLEAVEDILGALLEISHLDAGATRMEMARFAIEDVFSQLRLEFEPMALERGLRLTFAPSSLWVSSDRRLLRRLLQNLVSNAIKYTMEGRVLVGARRRGSEVSLSILDSGLGIPESKQLLIFREFERLPEATGTAPGIGLGLSIVERLAQVLDHGLSLRSTPGRGSVFSVLVPRAEPVASASAPSPGGAIVRLGSLEHLTVVAIDNDRHILAAIDDLLEGWNCLVVSGTNLPDVEAVLRARHLVPAVIVADYHVEDLDGLAIIKTLRDPFGPCQGVLITADRASHIRALAEAEDVRVLYKPLKPAALRSLLSQWLLGKAGTQ